MSIVEEMTPNSAFNQAKNMAARIITLLRPQDRSCAEQRRFKEFPFPDEEREKLEALLRPIGPECRELYRELRADQPFSAEERTNAEERLRLELEKGESSCPSVIEELERYLFRPVCFPQVWSEELDDIEKLREKRGIDGPVFNQEHVKDRALNANLLGLSLSGGGVRSATFNLGLLQGMAKHKILRRVDYLSMVSGGGYVGGWLAAWIKRTDFDKVEELLRDETSNPRCTKLEPIAFLRDYSSYLTPENGLLSADTWTAAVTWLRNTMLNLIVLLSGLAAILLAPRVLDDLMEYATGSLTKMGHLQEEIFTFLAISCQVLIIYRVGRNLNFFINDKTTSDKHANLGVGFGDTASDIQKFILIPALLSAWFCASRLRSLVLEMRHSPGSTLENYWMHFIGIGLMVSACFILLTFVQIRGGFVQCYLRETRNTVGNRRMARFLCVLLPVITAAVKTGLLCMIYLLLEHWATDPDLNKFPTLAAVWGIPLVLADFAVCIAIHIGLMGRNLPDDRREWWSRVAAYLGIYAVGLLALFSAAYFGPWLASSNFPLKGQVALIVILGWALMTGAGVIAAKSKEANKKDAEVVKRSVVLTAITAIAPYVFIIGLLMCVSIALHRSMLAVQRMLTPTGVSALGDYFAQVEFIQLPVELGFFAVLATVCWWMSRAVNINEFSMHHFYRNRLIRTFLGASHCNSDRKPNRLTGFDMTDDLPMATLRPEREPGLREYRAEYTGPYPIFNAALNLVHGERLSWQERKATSFVFTPRFCGYDYFSKAGTLSKPPLHNSGYRPCCSYAYPDGGIHLGTAMAISGAAASPNSGLHTSSAMAFLMTVLNVRLGWWMGNPRHDESWRRSGPRHGLMYLVRELFGMANDRQRHVYLSDGGHFENLGIYELVRRRCSVIIACDAEEDHAFSFDGLGGVIRKCFVDFGVRIDIDVKDIRPKRGEVYSTQHCALGKIYYPEGYVGTLVYIKASLMGDEPADLQTYLATHRGFPHQSTTEQFFEESQFESYHRLGLHVAKAVFCEKSASDVVGWHSPNRLKCEWQDPLASAKPLHAMGIAAGGTR